VWASADLNRFIRAYASGRLIERSTKLEQRSFIPGCGGEPPGPGQNSAGLALYQYETNCGTVLGYAGNFPAGYTLLIAATPNGRRSTVVFANEQLRRPRTRSRRSSSSCAAPSGWRPARPCRADATAGALVDLRESLEERLPPLRHAAVDLGKGNGPSIAAAAAAGGFRSGVTRTNAAFTRKGERISRIRKRLLPRCGGRLGYIEYDRRSFGDFALVFMRKPLRDQPANAPA
jgi:hypothetical protein